jgi:hypothetical protein
MPMLFDIWIPSMNLAIEYQGLQHFMDSRLIHGDEGLEQLYWRDMEKEEMLQYFGMNIIQIPFWLNMDSSLLESFIRKVCSILYFPH